MTISKGVCRSPSQLRGLGVVRCELVDGEAGDRVVLEMDVDAVAAEVGASDALIVWFVPLFICILRIRNRVQSVPTLQSLPRMRA